jgi:hypothetical protein
MGRAGVVKGNSKKQEQEQEQMQMQMQKQKQILRFAPG